MEKQRWPLAEAEGVAQALVELLAPACERIQIAGSTRRRKATVGDIELLCIPLPLEGALFYHDSLDQLLRDRLMPEGVLVPSINKKGSQTYGRLNKLLLHTASQIGVDIFSATPENWGMALLVRTGPAEFNIRAMSRFRELGMRGHAYGGVDTPTGHVSCPDEETVFRLLGWPPIPPEERT